MLRKYSSNSGPLLTLAILAVLGLRPLAAQESEDRSDPPSATNQSVITVAEPSQQALQQALRTLVELRQQGEVTPRVIELPAGTYRLGETIAIDSHLVGEGLTIRSAPDAGRARLSGAVPLDFIQKTEDGLLAYRLPMDWREQGVPRVILVNGVLSTAARHPNRGFMRVDEVMDDRRSGFTFRDQDWEGIRQIAPAKGTLDLVFLHDWSTSRLPVRSIDAQSRQLQTVGPIGCQAPHYAIDNFEAHPRFWLEGQASFADLPGEWYVDSDQGQVFVRGAKDGSVPEVELPLLETLLVVKGEEQRPLLGFNLEGIEFTGASYRFPPGGMATAQATMHEPRQEDGSRAGSNRPLLPAAVKFEMAEHCRLKSCRFQDLGGTALWIGSRTRSCEVEDCDFERCGGNAVNFGEDNGRQVAGRSWYQSSPEQVPTNHRLVNSRIRQPGVVMPGSVGVWASLNKGLEIAHNDISQTPYTGISLGWIWNDSPSPAADNHIHHNRISHVMRVLSDGGAIYTLGRQPGTVIEENQIEGVAHAAGRAESNGMFLDEGTTDLVIRGNTIKRVAQSPLRFHKAGVNHVDHNRWELRTAQTPPVRYNSTPEANVLLADNEVIAAPRRIYLIGNSLTWDTLPGNLSGEVQWHVDCGKSLPYINDNPLTPCVESSLIWPDALRRGPFDTIVVQPFYGSTLKQDVAVIDEWMKMQPTAEIVLHTGWARAADVVTEYEGSVDEQDAMTHHPEYFNRLQRALSELHPGRSIRRTYAMDLLYSVSQDIEANKAPVKELTELYRDAIHMTNEVGRPVMHQLMRGSVGETVQPLPIDSYFNEKVQQFSRSLGDPAASER